MGLFEDLSEAKPQGRGVKVTEPEEYNQTVNFVVRVDKTHIQESNQSLGTLFIVEFTILKGTQKNPPGAPRSWVQFPTSRKLTDPANIKLYVAALMGLESRDPEVPAEAFEKASNGGFDGTVLSLSTSKIVTKGTKRDFWPHVWSPFRGDAQALLDALPAEAPAESSAPSDAAPPPPPPAGLTKEAWLAGEGPATVHPTAPAYEYHPDHRDWGTRPVKS